jgi:hypothetical protein
MNASTTAEPDRAAPQRLSIGLVLLALLWSLGWWWLDGTAGVNLADEGYLWYGVEAVARGEVPMRDFQAYDPGRYLWGALWARALGHDLVVLRLACAIFGAAGVAAGLLAARRLSRNWLFLGAVALTLTAWMHPRYKCFEQSIALMAVYVSVRFLEKPTLHRHFCAGIFTGLMAVMGRNHGLYLVIAFALLIALAAQGRGMHGWFTGTLAWLGGIVAGYLPQLLMLKVVPGYWPEFQRLLAAIVAKGTNLPAAVPWPWRVDMALPNWRWASALLEGCFFVALPVFLALALVRIFRLRVDELAPRRVLAAATCVTLPYAHFAFSRPDIVHLGHAAPTLVLGMIALAFATGSAWGWKVATPALLAASVLANFFQTGLAQKIFPPPGGNVAVEVRGRPMEAGAEEAQLLQSAARLTGEVAGPDERILFLPNLPGLYPATDRRAPIRQLYFIFPATLGDESGLIRELDDARAQWVMLRDYPLDGRDELRFRHANPLLFAHLTRFFAPYQMEGLPADTVILRRKTRQSR